MAISQVVAKRSTLVVEELQRPIVRATKPSTLTSSRDRIREAAKSIFAFRGYEASSTAAICRLAGTSQSQLIKHFANKQGLLDAIFEYAWEQINPAISLAIEKVAPPREKLKIMVDIVLTFLEKDREMRTLFLLEGRRIRGDGHMVVLVPGFFEFVKTLDAVVKEMLAKGHLSQQLHPQAVRSAIMGMVEGLIRDQSLAKSSHFPASYSEADVRAILNVFLSACGSA